MKTYNKGTTALGLLLLLDNNCLNHGFFWRQTFFHSRLIEWNDDNENQRLDKYFKNTAQLP